MLEKLSLKTKMLCAFLAIGFLLLVSGAIGLVTLKDVSRKYAHVATDNLPNTVALGKMRYHAGEIIRRSMRAALARNDQERRKYKLETEEAVGKYAAAE